MPQKEIDIKEPFIECFKLLGLINTYGFSPDMKQKVEKIIQTYRQQYVSLITQRMINNVPESLKNNPKFQAGLKNWKIANKLE